MLVRYSSCCAVLLRYAHYFNLFRLFQRDFRRPRQALFRQGNEAVENDEVSSRVREEGRTFYHSNCNVLSTFQVDMRKVNLTVIRPWIAKKIVELIGFEDEVVVEYAMGLLEDESQPVRSWPIFL